MLFRATTQGIPRALTLIPSHNSRDTCRATTQGTPTIPPLKHHQKHFRSRLQNQQPKVTIVKSPGGGHVLPGAASFQTAWQGTRTTRCTKPLISSCCRHRLAERPSPPGAHDLAAPC
ncbi:hypothetical protein DEO72_LG1g2109 [Vigna unguiculata]|uniref:Uncharacterized protein n=1 Tax=Vigna unguiculata TaxID=3917 RepID=A0A4D6KKF2_VIGUN|nr:hypothetical protein DEO72_LG1g2109 [Vigna unguiculata]